MALSSLVTPWYKRTPARAGGGQEQSGSVAPTSILDYQSPAVAELIARSRELAQSPGSIEVLKAAHSIIGNEIRAVYALEENTPTSRTMSRGFGSCSQRLALLESVARALGVPTRVRILLIDRSFWYSRFPHIGFVLPDCILLAWPEFNIDQWQPVSELFGPIGCRGGEPFTNKDSETLFEAVGRCAVDWDDRAGNDAYNLSRFVRADYGYFTNRDQAFHQLGQTLCTPSRLIADPVLRRIGA
ncbi:hypothetical protein [Arthrobacter glacialis]|uniref:hypothetical protein n=1 Tax=Arthrobacter glacialis TaxID=1664 RepID=UPI000CD3E6D1|nr:hypothetical protein [Arthrobacter glacialis]POH57706.1 hypothetical protein CVS28_14400 [Arthrobacter glacialis]